MRETDAQRPAGLSPASFAAGLFAMLLMAIVIQYAEVLIGIAFPAEHAIPLPAVWVIILLSLVVAGFFLVTRIRLLSRAEMLCVAYALLIAAPLMTQGFWHRIVAITATNPRSGDFEKLDAFNDNLWPHGPNLLDGILARSNASLTFAGSHAWEPIEYDAGKTAELPVLRNTGAGDRAMIRIRLEPDQPGNPGVVSGEPYIVTVLLRPSDLAAESNYFGRLYFDDASAYAELFNSAAPSKKTFLHQTSFVRYGAYGVRIPANARGPFVLEFGLSGPGKLELSDPKMLNVSALEGIYKGKLIVSESHLSTIPPAERAGLIVRPNTLWSIAGIQFILAGYIPVRDWAMPMLAWTSVMLIILTGTLAVTIIMRKQWMENERFSLPLTRVPLALVDDEGGRALPPIWRNKLMWAGFVVAALWVLMKAAAFYNPRVPDPTINVPLQPYFSDPKWGTMFIRVRFEVVGIFLALCVFMELNVLLSLVVGYWLFRTQFWVGEATRWSTDPSYPYPYQQTMASYVTYGIVTLFFTRRYLGFVIRAALRGDPADGQALSYRGAVLLLLFTVIACVGWAWWMGIGVGGMLAFFLFLLLVGFVAARFRTECGLPWGYFGPQNLALFMIMMGGVTVFGPAAILFFYVTSFMLAPTVFFLIPGAQLELVELGQRWSVRPSHLFATAVLGAVGGMVIGGWVFLSNSYALGGETTRYSWAYDTKPWFFFSYNQEMASATNHLLGTAGEAAKGIDPSWYFMAFAAGGTILVTVMRQLFAGFWFHPIGVVLGSTNFMDYIWGSALTAWAVRGVVLWIGGGAAVKEKLQPFFIGFFLGAAVAELLIGIHGVHLRSIGIEQIYPVLIPA